MLIKFFKLVLILLFYQSPLYSKSKTSNDFNLHNLSNYFSGLVAHENKDNSEALKFFKSSRVLIKHHNPYLEKYILSLVLEGKVFQAINEIKQNSTKKNSNFFEANLILAVDSFKRKNYEKSETYLKKSYKFINNDSVKLIILETLKQYLYIFEKNQASKIKKNFGNFSFINEVFQRCYLDDENTDTLFKSLINNDDEVIYSRYNFFYINYLLEKNRYEEAKVIVNNLDYLNSSLLISQGKKWIEDKKLKEFQEIFSCKNPDDIISELFFLIANLYSSEGDYELSNFYLNISQYLNPKFLFNLSLLAENYYFNENYSMALKVLKLFSKKDDFYYWFRLKKEAQIISKQQNLDTSLKFINSKFKNIPRGNHIL